MEGAVIWLQAQCGLQMRPSGVKFGLVHQHSSEIHMGFHVVRVEAKREIVFFGRLLQLAGFLQHKRVIKMLSRTGWEVSRHPRAPLKLGNWTMHLPEPESAQRQDKYGGPF